MFYISLNRRQTDWMKWIFIYQRHTTNNGSTYRNAISVPKKIIVMHKQTLAGLTSLTKLHCKGTSGEIQKLNKKKKK